LVQDEPYLVQNKSSRSTMGWSATTAQTQRPMSLVPCSECSVLWPAHRSFSDSKRNFDLKTGKCGNDESYSVITFDARFTDKGEVELLLPETDELDAVLATKKWMVQQAKSEALGLGASGRVDIVGPDGDGAKNEDVNAGLSCGTSKLTW
jgi:hypothetical protein